MTTLTKLTLSQAARAAGKSKTQLSRQIENGKLSKEETASGAFVIDASELLRVYPEADLERTTLQPSRNAASDKKPDTVTAVQEARLELVMDERDRLRVELDNLRREQREERERHGTELARMMGVVEAAQRQLTDQRERVTVTPAPAVTPVTGEPATKRGWWPFRGKFG